MTDPWGDVPQEDWTQEPPPVELHRGQARMAERLVRTHGRDMRFVGKLGWFTWSGARWEQDEDGEPMRRVLDVLKDAIRESADADKAARAALLDDVRRCESATGVRGVLTIAEAIKPIALSHRLLDANPELLATPDGTLDLTTGHVRDSDRNDHITRMTAAAPGEDGRELWDAFLARVLPDEDVRAFVQRLMGVALLGEVREQVLPIFTGTGANGKGVFRDALMHAFGDYSLEVDPSLLMETKHEKHGTYKMALRGRRLVFTSETERGRRFAEATMKRLTGGDPIQANLMHKDAITFDPSHLLVMVTNHLPEVSGDDPAVWRRLIVVPFDVTIPPEERDPELPNRLRAAAPAVLAWAVEGWRAYQEVGLCPPDAVRARTEEYQASSDVLGRFFTERCYVNPHAFARARELFEAFTTWCSDSGERPPTEKAFAESLAARGHTKRRTRTGFVYEGVGLLADDDEGAA